METVKLNQPKSIVTYGKPKPSGKWGKVGAISSLSPVLYYLRINKGKLITE